MVIEKNISLRPYNSFGIDVMARDLARFSCLEELQSLAEAINEAPSLVLGGGSNILLVDNIGGWVFKNEIPGIEKVGENAQEVFLRVGAGVNWHDFVLYCIDCGFGGAENLSLIPGTVGAAPMQNIGAYGAELKDIFHELEAWHIRDKAVVSFQAEDCVFGYRESVFKNRFQHQFIILNVCFRMKKDPVIRTEYGAIAAELEKMSVTNPGIREVSEAVIRIRQSKLPDPAAIGNAGSFFKNPVITNQDLQGLRADYPSIPFFFQPDLSAKIPAAWLIEQCGWKGYRKGDAGCHRNQPLVLVNYGTASGQEILALSKEIARSVFEKFGIHLQREVNLIPDMA